MYTGLTHAHSGLRWLVLLFLLLAIISAYRAWKGGGSLSKMPLFALIVTHIQMLIGFVLYFIGISNESNLKISFMDGFMKNAITRFYTIEHLILMLIAIVLITVGYSKAKRKATEEAKGKTTFTFYLIALILILLAIPWPFRGLGAGWF
ncbi:MAG: hypothetical protein MI974_24470 [Chitinophagales bacterium]|nr:hypothetical protein [Chitinophagales bacterium]